MVELSEKLKANETRFRLFVNKDEFDDFASWREERNKFKMTREEAVKKVEAAFHNRGQERARSTVEGYVLTLEALGFLKFEEKKVANLFETCDTNGAVIRLEEWPEGMVLWRAGKIVYKSWEK